jgi:flavin reductase (DIM6/NTAB) family NADH-FMN oxidoreductase RutF
MGVRTQLRQAFKRVAFGPHNFAQQCPVGLRDPQTEVVVLLRSARSCRDVTHRHLIACGFPFTIGIGFGPESPETSGDESCALDFHERSNGQQLLGRIDLRPSAVIPVADHKMCLFQPRGYSNYCLPRPWLWARYLQYATQRRRAPSREMPLTLRELHSMCVFYICPRPVVLVTVTDGDGSNVFPMNLMGPVGAGYFSFALNASRPVTSVVERVGRVALSTVPVEQAALTMSLGKNHREESVDFGQLPFATLRSRAFDVPVPDFALRVRELEIDSVRQVGSHKLFIGRTIHEEYRGAAPEFFMIHGIYEARRQWCTPEALGCEPGQSA